MQDPIIHWRLYPIPSQTTPDCHSFSKCHQPLPKLHDFVFIRPKSANEQGIIGRVVNMTRASAHESSFISSDSSKFLRRQGKKRKAVEDIRISIQKKFHHDSQEVIWNNIRPSRIVPIYGMSPDRHPTPHDKMSSTFVILTPDTANYRQLAMAHIQPRDHVLEIGCSTGGCTVLLLRTLMLFHRHTGNFEDPVEFKTKEENYQLDIGKIVAFDTGSDMIRQTQQHLRSELHRLLSIPYDRLENNDTSLPDPIQTYYSQIVHLHKVDALTDPNTAYLSAATNGTSPNVILIDIGGNRERRGVMNMIHWVQTAFRPYYPRTIIVKSEALVKELMVQKEDALVIHNNGPANPYLSKDGIIENAQQWLLFHQLLKNSSKHCSLPKQPPPKYTHPRKAPLVFSPKGDRVPICRFHNYHVEGCKKYCKDSNETNQCPFDHEYCHWCRKFGHVARECSGL